MKRLFARCAAIIAMAGLTCAPALAEYPFTGDLPNNVFFFSVEGGYAFTGGDVAQFSPTFPASVIPGNSQRYAAHGGMRFSDTIDFAAGVSGTFFPSVVTSAGGTSVNNYGFYFTADLEAGYRMMMQSTDVRFFGGLRGLWYHQNTDATGAATANIVMGTWGVGPRVGFDAAHRLGDSAFKVFGGASTSVLFGGKRQVGTYTGGSPNQNNFNIMFNADARAGVSVEMTPGLALSVGYRADYLGNGDLAFKTTAAGGPGTGTSSRLFHGPFVSLSGSL